MDQARATVQESKAPLAAALDIVANQLTSDPPC
jgi:hypothetical protein